MLGQHFKEICAGRKMEAEIADLHLKMIFSGFLLLQSHESLSQKQVFMTENRLTYDNLYITQKNTFPQFILCLFQAHIIKQTQNSSFYKGIYSKEDCLWRADQVNFKLTHSKSWKCHRYLTSTLPTWVKEKCPLERQSHPLTHISFNTHLKVKDQLLKEPWPNRQTSDPVYVYVCALITLTELSSLFCFIYAGGLFRSRQICQSKFARDYGAPSLAQGAMIYDMC